MPAHDVPVPELRFSAIMQRPKVMIQASLCKETRKLLWVGDANEQHEEAEAWARQADVESYKILHTGGFLKLFYVNTGRTYWYAQALLEHKVPDWKFHFSVVEEELGQAWDILSAMFIERRCRSGMKVQVQGGSWPTHMKGRELTVYIFRHHPRMESLGAEELLPMGSVPKADEQEWAFWEAFHLDAEAAFAAAGLRVQGLADGDLALGSYSSIRNESFCVARSEWNLPESWHGIDLGARPDVEQWVYPPNIAGWNAANHPVPWQRPSMLNCWQPVAVAIGAVGIALVFCRLCR